MMMKGVRFFLLSLVAIHFILVPVGARADEEDDDKALKPVPKAYADKHMPKGWWTDPKIVEEGKKLFETVMLEFEYKGKKEEVKEGCATCHGIDPKKDRPKQRGARDFRVPKKMNQYSDSYWFWRVSEGVPKTKMPAWKDKLKEEEIWKIIAYEHTMSHGSKPEAHEHKEIQISVEK
ncbi:MAG: cytochrome c [Candidatus Manganitrophus sp.]|nr:MAG: cytochrome c [Candidatus Manganitrophus sp.]